MKIPPNHPLIFHYYKPSILLKYNISQELSILDDLDIYIYLYIILYIIYICLDIHYLLMEPSSHWDLPGTEPSATPSVERWRQWPSETAAPAR